MADIMQGEYNYGEYLSSFDMIEHMNNRKQKIGGIPKKVEDQNEKLRQLFTKALSDIQSQLASLQSQIDQIQNQYSTQMNSNRSSNETSINNRVSSMQSDINSTIQKMQQSGNRLKNS